MEVSGPLYRVENIASLIRTRRARRAAGAGIGSTVLLLGLTSLFTDISSEMVATVLPVYFVGTLSFSPFAFGIIDGLYQGAAAIVRLVGGFSADRWRRHKEVAGIGYGLSAISKLGYLAAGASVPGASAVVTIDRVGKGLRTAPRDAMISLSSTAENRATAFGVHRGLDTMGAMLGPAIAFGLLELTPGDFDPLFVVSFCFGLIGVAILVLFVRNPPAPAVATAALTPREAVGTLASRPFRRLVIAGGLLGLVTISDGFLYLGLERNFGFRPSLFPLLFVATAFVYMLFAVPMGRLADRVGARKVFIGGYALLGIVYTSLLVTSGGTPVLVGYLIVLGVFYAATDGVLMAIAANLLPERAHASGMAILLTSVGIGRLVSSIVFGLLWTQTGLENAVVVFLSALVVTVIVSALILRSTPRVAHA